MTIRNDIIAQAKKESADRGKLVFMGNGTIVEVPGKQNQIYVTDVNGRTHTVWNTKAQNILNHPAWVKWIDKKAQVTELWDIYTDVAYTKVGPHHSSHEWGAYGADIVRVWGDQWMPWRVEPTSDTGLTVTVREPEQLRAA